MKKGLKIYNVDFEPIFPTGYKLIIVANNIEEANVIASNTITHTTEFEVTEIKITEPQVIVYESGDY